MFTLDNGPIPNPWSSTHTSFYLSANQICNAGFLVPPTQRGLGLGRVLARSYLHYAPRLGYQASVFNLVYVNNVASVKGVPLLPPSLHGF